MGSGLVITIAMISHIEGIFLFYQTHYYLLSVINVNLSVGVLR